MTDFEMIADSLSSPGCWVWIDTNAIDGMPCVEVLEHRTVDIENIHDIEESSDIITEMAKAHGYDVHHCVWVQLRYEEAQVGEYGRVEIDGYWEVIGVCKATTDYLISKRPKVEWLSTASSIPPANFDTDDEIPF